MSNLQPIRDALADAKPPAEAEPKPPTPEETAEARRAADESSIKAAVKRGGRDTAYRLARTLGWTAQEFEALLAPRGRPKSAKPKEDEAPPPADDAPSSAPGGGDGSRFTKAAEPIKPLPDGFPLKPLGKQGSLFHYLDPLGQVRSVVASDHSAMGLRDLLGPHIGAAWEHFPKFSAASGNQDGWKADRLAESLMQSCARRGIFDAISRVRGRGAWLDEMGGLVLHAGDGVLYGGEWKPTGELGKFIYSAQEAGPRPADAMPESADWLHEILGILDTWSWRSDADSGAMRYGGHSFQSILVAGFVAGAIFGGALPWRPMMWVTGSAGSGKSELLRVVGLLCGDALEFQNATEASVRGVIGQSTRPVILDEVENKADGGGRNSRLVELTLVMASGGKAARSSSDHTVTTFELRSSALFGSIVIPAMQGAVVSRFVVLDLDPLPKGAKLDPDIGAFYRKLTELGRQVRAAVIAGWPRLSETRALWAKTLADLGHNQRSQDVYGNLLALFDLLMWREAADSDTREELARMVSLEAIEQKTSGTSDTMAMLQFVGTTLIDAFRGGTKYTVWTLIKVAVDWKGAAPVAGEPTMIRELLRERGVYVERDHRTFDDFVRNGVEPPVNWAQQGWRVTLPNQSEGLRAIFAASRWRTDPGATGGWSQEMQRLAGVLPENSRKLGGRGWSVPVEVFLREE